MEEKKECKDVDIVEKVKKYFYEDDSFSNTFEDFARDNCDVFDVEAEEMKLEYTELHKEFVALFESKIQDFVESQGYTIPILYQEIQEVLFISPYCFF